MNVNDRVVLLVAGWLLALGGEASAQLFGARTEGTPVSRRVRPSLTTSTANGPAATSTGLQGARFLRENRSAKDFVGSDAEATAKHFVGAQEVGDATMVQSAVGDLRSRLATAVANRQLQAAAATPTPNTAMNPPRLEVSFAYSAPSAEELPSVLLQRLTACPEFHPIGPIAVSLAGRTAIVRGTVASARDRFLAQQLLLFEPGISTVKNDLLVQDSASSPTSPGTTSPASPKAPAP
jgi:hypothetical protein